MKPRRLSNHLRLLFIAAVLIPCVALTVIAVRSIDREEAFLEKQLLASLDAELSHAVTLLRDELRLVQEDLILSTPAAIQADFQAAFGEWKRKSPIVGVPFLLSSDFRILWPARDSYLSEDDLSFLSWNREFVTDQVSIPVYQNVAVLYKDQILGDLESKLNQKATLTTSAAVPPVAEDKKNRPRESLSRNKETTKELGLSSGSVQNRTLSEEALKPTSPVQLEPQLSLKFAPLPAATRDTFGGEAAKKKVDDLRMEQQAIGEFEKNEGVRQKVLDTAMGKGQKAEPRNVTPGLDRSSPAPAPLRVESIYISEPLKFSQITAGKSDGLIPRFIAETLNLLFWKRAPDGRIFGCVINGEELKARLLRRLPDVYTSSRILTLLDENGRPLITPTGEEKRDWRRPLAAQEVGEILPRWEAAAYPTDPGAAASRARTTRLMLGILIAVLLVSILGGGTLVLNTLQSEMNLARQKTTFVTNVSHELKTPLTSIRMFAEMLKDGRQPDAEKQRNYLGLMVSETDRLTRLINNVLDFSRMEKGKRVYAKNKLDAAALAAEVVESQRLRLEPEGFLLSVQSSGPPVFVEADEEAIKQALLNLLSNAEKYSPTTKDIAVEIGEMSETVLIDVKDRGLGLPPGEAKKIFREFYRVDQTLTAGVRGSGLGLTIALRIIRDHGGDIQYLSRDGGGSVFRISLPRVEKT